MSAKKSNDIKSMHSRLKDNPIAIIGMSAIFPESKNLQAYWDNIINEVDCIVDVPPSRWNTEDYFDPDPKAEDKTYCKRGGFIPDIDFNPMEFGLPPNILEVTDVHQLISLILSKEVLKDGGYENATDQQKKNIGVILGVGGGQKAMWPLISRLQYPVWEKVLKSSGLSSSDTQKIIDKIKKAYVGWEENSFPGALGNVIAGRIANRLNLGGTNCVVDAACASALSGIRMAVSELLEYRADMMITGGVDTDNSAYMYLCFSKTQAFSKGEKSTPFDNNTDGMLIGEGIGMVLLRRLEDAERDNDRIYAVIKGMGSSSDGKFKSIYAPRPEGQVLALSRAYKDAEIPPSTIGMLEAHGTGTSAGDIAEVEALKIFYAEHDSEKQHIAMGSVKSQIGHIKNAAGSAGLIKTALALYHKILPATINVKEPNKEFDLENSPFYLNTQVRPWVRAESDTPRRAGLSAFGFGGTNFHFVLEEHTREMSGRYRINSVAQPVLLSAPNPDELITACENAVLQLDSEDREKHFRELSALAKSADIPLEHARVGFIADSDTEVIELLNEAINNLKEKPDEDSWSLPKGIHFQKKGIDPKGKVVALFAGQGSPYLNMGKELVSNFPPLMKIQSQMDDLFINDNLKPLSQVVFPTPVFDKTLKKAQEKKLQLTEHAQPAIGVFSSGQFQLLKDAGLKPDFTAGHSFGELTALWAADVYSTEDYLMLAKARGKAMAAPDEPDFDAGSMLAVMGEIENLQMEIEDFPEITIANYNSRNQIVLAGPTDDIKKVQKFLKKRDYRTIRLGVSAAFHTKLMGHAQKPFAETIGSVKFRKPKCKVYSNATGKPYSTAPKTIQTTLQEHILNSVLFKQEIESIYKDGGYFFIEFGPQSIMTKLVDNILKDKPFISVALNASARKDADRQYREAVVKLKVAGLALKDIDPYEFIPEITAKKKNALTLKISGTNYVSEKTRTVFEEALQDGHQIQTIVNAVATPQLKEQMSHKQQTEKPVTVQHAPVDLNKAMVSMERGLANFYNHQNETLRIHEQFLNNQSEYSRSFFQIMQMQAQAGPNAASNDVTQSITQFHVHQGETLRVHEQYLRHQTEYSKQSFELIRQQQATLTGDQIPQISQIPVASIQPQVYSPPVQPERQTPVYQPPPPVAFTPTTPPVQQPIQPEVVAPVNPPLQASAAPAVKQQTAGIDSALLTRTLLDVVAEKTGYQSDMLEISMDMEADLGIDSIKRVEILNGIQEKLPDLPQVNPEELAELRTLEQIIEYMLLQAGAGKTISETPQQQEPVAGVSSGALGKDLFVKVLLEVVAEKTGYQSDMLELNMDMEADLGIDSIKRVEILNGMQEKLPGMPQVNPAELAELRTLEQIADYMATQAGNSSDSSAGEETVPINNTNVQAAGIDIPLLTKTLLEVVSEKTGYLVDMLELSMDMEADLGIDSIKRVEILNGMQEKLPELPEVNPEELAELRTLEQIVEKMGQSVSESMLAGTAVKKKGMNQNMASSDG